MCVTVLCFKNGHVTKTSTVTYHTIILSQVNLLVLVTLPRLWNRSDSLSNHTSYTPTHHAVSQREERAVHSGHDTRHDTGGNSGHHGKDHHGSNITGFLQPFTVEYNIILAGVWFIVWQNIGRGLWPVKFILSERFKCLSFWWITESWSYQLAYNDRT